jgi:hypothetical protein
VRMHVDTVSTVYFDQTLQDGSCEPISRLGYCKAAAAKRVSLLTVLHARRRPNRSSHQVGLAAGMAVPDGRNGIEEDDDIIDAAEVFGDVSDDEEVPPHLRALADAAQSGDVAALLAALGTGLIRPSPPRSSLVGWLAGTLAGFCGIASLGGTCMVCSLSPAWIFYL